jgi:hypothetical protein
MDVPPVAANAEPVLLAEMNVQATPIVKKVIQPVLTNNAFLLQAQVLTNVQLTPIAQTNT